MSGNYVNFGVFELYGDKALSDCLSAIMELLLHIPIEDLMVRHLLAFFLRLYFLILDIVQFSTLQSYPKISLSCVLMLEILFRNHTQAMMELSSSILFQIITALQQGLKSPRAQITTHCAGALDHICTYAFRAMGKDNVAARQVARHLQYNPEMLSSFISLIFGMIIAEDVPSQWSLSRPLLGLILIHEQAGYLDIFYYAFNLFIFC
jgi:exportin-7